MKANLSCRPGLFIFTRAFFSISTVTWAGRLGSGYGLAIYYREREGLCISLHGRVAANKNTTQQQLTSSFESPGVNQSVKSCSSTQTVFYSGFLTWTKRHSVFGRQLIQLFTFPPVDVVGDVHLVLYLFLVFHNMPLAKTKGQITTVASSNSNINFSSD